MKWRGWWFMVLALGLTSCGVNAAGEEPSRTTAERTGGAESWGSVRAEMMDGQSRRLRAEVTVDRRPSVRLQDHSELVQQVTESCGLTSEVAARAGVATLRVTYTDASEDASLPGEAKGFIYVTLGVPTRESLTTPEDENSSTALLVAEPAIQSQNLACDPSVELPVGETATLALVLPEMFAADSSVADSSPWAEQVINITGDTGGPVDIVDCEVSGELTPRPDADNRNVCAFSLPPR